MRIAVIGSGISGLTAAHLLSAQNEVTVFEANDQAGGHTHTVDVRVASGAYAIDTGFIVFNDWTYPHFITLMEQIGVTWKDSAMSFSVKAESSGLEYNGTSLNSLFAQRRNLFNPRFLKMIKDILRFNQESLDLLSSSTSGAPNLQTLGSYLKEHNYSRAFIEYYIVPMGAAIWSSSSAQMLEFPIEYFVRFFKNHGMLSVDHRPTWKVIQGGSRSYLKPLMARFAPRVRLQSPVVSVLRHPDHVGIRFLQQGSEHQETFDHVILSCHSDQVIQMLADPTGLETEILKSFSYQPNSTVLHTDTRVLPKKQLAWAAWNYWVPQAPSSKVAVTYNMNILQGIEAPETFCVSLNMDASIRDDKILKRMVYHHPVYTQASFAAQKRWGEISGRGRTHFCGAYWGYGFHEDGVNSALAVCKSFGVTL